MLYPKTITYIYPDRETCILDSNSSFFHNKELTTMQFQSISLFSGLTEMGPSPEQALRYWQQAGERAASMYQATRILMSSRHIGWQRLHLSGGRHGFGLRLLLRAHLSYPRGAEIHRPVYLLAAIAMALYTDHRQRQAQHQGDPQADGGHQHGGGQVDGEQGTRSSHSFARIWVGDGRM